MATDELIKIELTVTAEQMLAIGHVLQNGHVDVEESARPAARRATAKAPAKPTTKARTPKAPEPDSDDELVDEEDTEDEDDSEEEDEEETEEDEEEEETLSQADLEAMSLIDVKRVARANDVKIGVNDKKAAIIKKIMAQAE